MEESSSLEQVFIISKIEGSEATRVHLNDRRRIVRGLALVLLQIGSIEAIQRGILVTFTAEIVKPITECLAMRDSDCVSPYNDRCEDRRLLNSCSKKNTETLVAYLTK